VTIPFPYGLKGEPAALELLPSKLEIDGIIRKQPDIDGVGAESGGAVESSVIHPRTIQPVSALSPAQLQ